MTNSFSKIKGVLLLFLLCSLIFVVYQKTQNFTFLNFDDNVYVTENPFVTSGLSFNNIKWAFTTHHGGHWHPLTWIFHQIDVELFGLDSGWHHLSNVLLFFIGLSLLLFWFRSLGFKAVPIFLATLLFAIHPFRVESVVWVTEKKDMLSFSFGILTLWLYTQNSITPKSKYKYASYITFSCGLLCKPSIVILPVLMILLDEWPLKKPLSLKKHIQTKGIYFTLSLILSIIVIASQQSEGALKSLTHTSLQTRFITTFYGYVVYLIKSFTIGSQSIFHPYQIYPLSYGVNSCFLILLISILLIFFRKKCSPIFFAWFWFLIALLPVIGFIKVGGQFYAERWTLWPHIGLSFFILAGLSVTNRTTQMATLILSLCFVSFYTLKTYGYLPHFRNSQTLFQQALKADPNNFLAHTNLGHTYLKVHPQRAKDHFKKAIQIHPDYAVAHNNLGLIEAQQQNFNEAYSHFKKSHQINPNNIDYQYNKALTELYLQKLTPSLKSLIKIYSQNPSYTASHQTLNYILKFNSQKVCQISLNPKDKQVLKHYIQTKKLKLLDCL